MHVCSVDVCVHVCVCMFVYRNYNTQKFYSVRILTLSTAICLCVYKVNHSIALKHKQNNDVSKAYNYAVHTCTLNGNNYIGSFQLYKKIALGKLLFKG